MQKLTRTTSGEEAHFLEVPKTVLDPQEAPQLQLEIIHLQRRGAMLNPYESNAISQMTINENTGTFTYQDSPMNGDIPLYRSPFTPEEVKDVILRHKKYSAWLLYGFILRAYSITLFYYNVYNPDLRGVIELGRGFSGMQVNIDKPDG